MIPEPPESKPKSKSNCKSYLTNYLFLLWDGLGFFGFDDNKLGRLEGKKPKWHDRFFNKRWLASNLILAAVLDYVLIGQYSTLGDQKSLSLIKEE